MSEKQSAKSTMPVVPESHAVVEPEDWLWPNAVADWFARRQPIELDLGCGKGRFLIARATAHPEVNFLAIERQLRRVRKIDAKLRRQAIENVRLFRVEGQYAIRYLIPDACLRTVYLFHPDPWPKARHAHHRLLSADFLHALHRVLEPRGVFHFCTDHLPYFHPAVDMLEADSRFSEVPAFFPSAEEQSDFERIFRHRRPIGRYSCQKLDPSHGTTPS